MNDSIFEAKIRIQSKENATWQGTLSIAGQTYPFKSEMELLLLINRFAGGIDGFMGWKPNTE
jgi:hypothetical protein